MGRRISIWSKQSIYDLIITKFIDEFEFRINDITIRFFLFIEVLSGSLVFFCHVNKKLPQVLSRLLRFVSPAVLSALILPAIIAPDGNFYFSLENGWIAGIIVAAVVALCTRNTSGVIGAGMGVLWLHQWIMV